MQLGHSGADDECRKVEESLKKFAGDFAINNGKYDVFITEQKLQPNHALSDSEWALMPQQDSEPIPAQARRPAVNPQAEAKQDWTVRNGIEDSRAFTMCLRAVTSERHIGLDPGKRNFGIAVVDKSMDEPLKLVAAGRYNLGLPDRFEASDAFLAVTKHTPLWQWMQQMTTRTIPQVRRVIVHVESTSPKNPCWKELGIGLAQSLQQSAASPDTSCIVKLSKADVHRESGPMFRMGQNIVD